MITYKNLYGVRTILTVFTALRLGANRFLPQMKVVEFTYKLIYLYGGRYQNKGLFLTGVTVVPAQISVLWGFNFDCKVSIPTTVNSAYFSPYFPETIPDFGF
jgi:hypothetical protein